MSELAILEQVNLPALNNNQGAIYAEEMDGLEFAYDRVKIPSGGGLTFEIGEGEEVEIAKEIIGVIVDHHPVNAYWLNTFTGGNTPPDCASMDGKTGNNFGECATCMNNQWGSDPLSGGKLCKNQRRIYILQEGCALPILLTLPPTSLKSFGNYISKRIIAKDRHSRHVLTKFTLKKVANSTGINYSEVVCTCVGELPEALKESMDRYANEIKQISRNMSVADAYPEQKEQPF